MVRDFDIPTANAIRHHPLPTVVNLPAQRAPHPSRAGYAWVSADATRSAPIPVHGEVHLYGALVRAAL